MTLTDPRNMKQIELITELKKLLTDLYIFIDEQYDWSDWKRIDALIEEQERRALISDGVLPAPRSKNPKD